MAEPSTNNNTSIQGTIPYLPRHETVRVGDHILGLYPDQRSKLEEAFGFLEGGIRNGEVAMLVTDAITKDRTLERMGRELNVDASELERNTDIIIKGSREWYVPNGDLDCKLVIARWNSLVSFSLLNGKKGLRVFGDLSPLFEYGLSKKVIEYESCFRPRFDIPITAVCAYLVKDMGSLELADVEKLEEHHYRLWA